MKASLIPWPEMKISQKLQDASNTMLATPIKFMAKLLTRPLQSLHTQSESQLVFVGKSSRELSQASSRRRNNLINPDGTTHLQWLHGNSDQRSPAAILLL
jgi:hypothetical protein